MLSELYELFKLIWQKKKCCDYKSWKSFFVNILSRIMRIFFHAIWQSVLWCYLFTHWVFNSDNLNSTTECAHLPAYCQTGIRLSDIFNIRLQINKLKKKKSPYNLTTKIAVILRQTKAPQIKLMQSRQIQYNTNIVKICYHNIFSFVKST